MRYKLIKSCNDCEHRDHTGAFTPNGALPQCHHPCAKKNFRMSDHTGRDDREKGDGKYRKWKIARIDNPEKIPKWCPMPEAK